MILTAVLSMVFLTQDSTIVATRPEAQIPLWQTLRRGMTGEEAATALRNIAGVKSVTVKAAKDGTPKLAVSYTKEGVEVVDIRHDIETTFDGKGLKAVSLTSQSCNSLAVAKYEILRGLLEEKYGKYKEQRETTPENTIIAIRTSYIETPTRVMIRIEPQPAPREMLLTGNKFSDLVVQMHNSAVQSQIAACPTDFGQRAKMQVIYTGNKESSQSDAILNAQQSAKKASDKSKL